MPKLENGLSFAPNKTVIIHFSRLYKSPHPTPLVMGDETLPFSEKTKYLGVTLTSKLNWTPHIIEKATKAKALLFAARRYVNKRFGLRPHLMSYVWKTCIRPIILYGCHVWAHKLNKTTQTTLQNLERQALLLISPVHRGTPTAALQIIHQSKPLHLQALETAGSGLGLNGSKGHLLSLASRKPNIPVSTPETILVQNWTNKANISKVPSLDNAARTQVFTDGSKLDNNVGSGVSIWQHDKEIKGASYGLPARATVYQAELYAIEKAIGLLQTLCIKGSVTIHSDSLSAIQALQGTEITSAQCHRTLLAVNEYGKKNQLSIHWIKAHVGHPGNERADTLAKLGTKLPPQGDMGLSPKIIKAEYAQAIHDMRQKSWENSDTCRQSQNLAPVSRPHPGILPTQQRKPRPVHPMDHRFLQPNET